MEGVEVKILADNPGDWAFHCRSAYHLETGMMHVFKLFESIDEVKSACGSHLLSGIFSRLLEIPAGKLLRHLSLLHSNCRRVRRRFCKLWKDLNRNFFLWLKKRIENSPKVLFVNSFSGVVNFDNDLIFVEFRGKSKRAAVRHRLNCVEREIQQNLFDLFGIERDRRLFFASSP